MGGGKANRTLGFAWRNLDALLVMAAAAVVLAIEIVGSPDSRLIDSVTLALLGVTAFALLRDRSHSVNLKQLQQLAGDAMSDRPYEVVWQENEWDLKDRDNTTIIVTEELRITHNDVASIAHWSQGDGKDTSNRAQWRRSKGDRWLDAERIYDLAVRGGTKVLYCFDEEHQRGDNLEWRVERDAVGRFPSAHESVSLIARTKSDYPRVMRITWPTGSPPSKVEIRHGARPARPINPKKRNGRRYIEERVSGLAIGERVELAWTW